MENYKLGAMENPFCGINLGACAYFIRRTGQNMPKRAGMEKIHNLYYAAPFVPAGYFSKSEHAI